jgi:hypothetical protein
MRLDEFVATTGVHSLSRLRRVRGEGWGAGSFRKTRWVEGIGFSPPAALRASTSPASGRGQVSRTSRFNSNPSYSRPLAGEVDVSNP